MYSSTLSSMCASWYLWRCTTCTCSSANGQQSNRLWSLRWHACSLVYNWCMRWSSFQESKGNTSSIFSMWFSFQRSQSTLMWSWSAFLLIKQSSHRSPMQMSTWLCRRSVAFYWCSSWCIGWGYSKKLHSTLHWSCKPWSTLRSFCWSWRLFSLRL